MHCWLRVASAILILAGAFSARAQSTFIWTGGGGAAHQLNHAANWQGNVAPSHPGDTIRVPALSDELLYNINIEVSAPHTLGNLVFEGGYNMTHVYGAGPLTLNGSVSAASSVSLYVPLVLAAGSRVFSIEHDDYSAAVFISGQVSGAGQLVKNGSGILGMFGTTPNTYTGGTVVNAGSVFVLHDNSLGTGTVTLNGGSLTASSTSNSIELANDFRLGAVVGFGSYIDDGYFRLGTAGNTLAPVGPAQTQVTLRAENSAAPIIIGAAMIDGAGGPTTYTFENTFSQNGSFRLDGSNTYSGGTVVKDRAVVVFEAEGAVPAAGLIVTEEDGYAGIGDTDVSASTFLGRFNAAQNAGTIGFEYGTFSGNLNLAAFTANGNTTAIGTQSWTTLTGTISTVGTSGEYRFRSSGRLFLTSTTPLSGASDVVARSLASAVPGLPARTGFLVLDQSGGNTYTGQTIASGAAIVFGTVNSMPAATSLVLHDGGYIGFTDQAGMNYQDLIDRFGFISGNGVLGIDSDVIIHGDGNTPVSYGGSIDLSAINNPVFLGTASAATLSGAITAINGGGGDYYFTGYEGGTLTVATSGFSGSRKLHIGLPGANQDWYTGQYSNVILAGGNTHTGGTVLNSGLLALDAPSALGTGPLMVNASGTDERVVLQTEGTVANAIQLQHGTLAIDPNENALTLSGQISGSGTLHVLDGAQITNHNTYSGGTILEKGTYHVTFNDGLGSNASALSLNEGANVIFNTSAPAIGNLTASGYDLDDGVVAPAIVLSGGGNSVLTVIQDGNWGDTFEGSIVQAPGTIGSLVKNGAGRLVITGEQGGDNNYLNHYSGGTQILQGTLVAGNSNALGTGAIAIGGGSLEAGAGVVLNNAIAFNASGGRLGGTGTFGAPIAIGANTTLAPGNSPGEMTFAGGLTFASGGTLDFEIQLRGGTPGIDSDLLHISGGSLVVASTPAQPFTIRLTTLSSEVATLGQPGELTDFDANQGFSLLLARSSGGATFSGFAANKFAFDLDDFANDTLGGVFSLSQGTSGGNAALYLNFTPVPEPSTYALLLAGLGALAWQQQRRRRG